MLAETIGLNFRVGKQEQQLTDSDENDTESPGNSLDIGNTNSLDIYGITPPSNQRETKRNKEKIKSHKSKKVNQEFKEFIDSQRREKQRDAKRQEAAIQNMREDMASCKLDDEEEVLLDVSQTERQIKRKDSSKAFKTSRGYERDFKKNSSGDLAMDISPADLVRVISSIKVDSPNRYYSLNSKQVPGVSDDTSSIEPSVQRRQISSHVTECPKDRAEFYRIFSQLINMGSEKKKDKEMLQRQLSSEQLLWQNKVNDLIWLELQAWYRDVSPEEQDRYLIATREGAKNILNEVMDFHVDLNSVKNNTDSDNFEAGSAEFGRHQSIDIGRVYSSHQISDLSEIFKRHREAMHQVSGILEKLETVEKLYPTLKAMGHDHPVCATDAYQMRISTLHLWLNLSKDLGHKLQLMAKVLYIDQIPDAAWPLLEIDSPNSVEEECSSSRCLEEEDEDSVDGIGNNHFGNEKGNTADSGISTLLDHEKKSVRFDIGSSSDASSPSDSQNVPGVSPSPPSDASTPHRPVRSFSHTSHSSTMSRSNSSMSVEELTHLSIYRYYADRYETCLFQIC